MSLRKIFWFFLISYVVLTLGVIVTLTVQNRNILSHCQAQQIAVQKARALAVDLITDPTTGQPLPDTAPYVATIRRSLEEGGSLAIVNC